MPGAFRLVYGLCHRFFDKPLWQRETSSMTEEEAWRRVYMVEGVSEVPPERAPLEDVVRWHLLRAERLEPVLSRQAAMLGLSVKTLRKYKQALGLVPGRTRETPLPLGRVLEASEGDGCVTGELQVHGRFTKNGEPRL